MMFQVNDETEQSPFYQPFFLKSSQRREVDVPQRLSEHKNWSVGAREAFFNPR